MQSTKSSDQVIEELAIKNKVIYSDISVNGGKMTNMFLIKNAATCPFIRWQLFVVCSSDDLAYFHYAFP